MNKAVIAIIAVAIVIAGSYFLLINYGIPEPISDLSPQPIIQENSRLVSESAVQTANTEESTSNNQGVVTYSDSGYSPNPLRIKAGATVTFKNSSSRAMWTASAMHPTHRAYPITGGCIGSTFDACRGVQSGDSWSFKFDIAGTWKYHDHLNPSATGSIIVEE